MYKHGYNLKKQNPFSKYRGIIRKKGLHYFMKKCAYVYLFPPYWRYFKKNKKFAFKDETLYYFYHPYNHAYINERTIEIPLILSFIRKYTFGAKILEIGNVLSHYIETDWDILDKFEEQDNVINKDIVDFKPAEKYDLIVSISTMEHVGFDEAVKDNKKILASILHIKKNCLKKEGKFVFTVPIGWNKNLDNILKRDAIDFSEVYYFKRISWNNDWRLSAKGDVLKTKFAKPCIGANGIVLGVVSDE
ncbi:hypothetical protein GF336_03880 [Candidatus Woesearchaeota archaeon]|nr:hypothetical protein [Candidatus Woesearchaeota archaeon]